MVYAKGPKAWGQCARCGHRDYLHRLVEDGYLEGLLVHPSCWDGKHPQDFLPEREDPVSVYRPSANADNIDDVIRFPNYSITDDRTNSSMPINITLGSAVVTTT